MNNNPLVCICVPNYNNEKTLSQTLDSLVNQTYPNIIIKVFDNASTDGSMEILRAYSAKYPSLHVFQNETNIGGEANFTKCIENMEGDYAAIYHSDDIYMPNMVAEQVKVLENDNTLVAVSTNANQIDENSRIQKVLVNIPAEFNEHEIYIIESQLQLFKLILKYGNLIVCPSVMARTEIYKTKIIAWNGNEYKTSADLDVWLRLLNFGQFTYLTRPYMNYRVSTASYSYHAARSRVEKHDLFLVLDTYKKKYESLLNMIDKNNYKFLNFKDDVNIATNLLIQKKNIKMKNFLVMDKDIFSVAMASRKNFLILCFAFFLRFLNLFRNWSMTSYFLYKIRF